MDHAPPRENSCITTTSRQATPDGTCTSAPRPALAGRHVDVDVARAAASSRGDITPRADARRPSSMNLPRSLRTNGKAPS